MNLVNLIGALLLLTAQSCSENTTFSREFVDLNSENFAVLKEKKYHFNVVIKSESEKIDVDYFISLNEKTTAKSLENKNNPNFEFIKPAYVYLETRQNNEIITQYPLTERFYRTNQFRTTNFIHNFPSNTNTFLVFEVWQNPEVSTFYVQYPIPQPSK